MAQFPRKPLLPREHGGWAMLFLPLLAGVGIVGKVGGQAPLLLFSVFFLYLARYPLFLWARSPGRPFPRENRRWFAMYLALGLLLGLPLLLQYRLFLLLPLALPPLALLSLHLWLAMRRRERSYLAEFLGVLGLSWSGAVAVYVSGGSFTTTAFPLWLASILYFGQSVFYVKMKVAFFAKRLEKPSLMERIRHGQGLLLYVAAMLLIARGFTWGGILPRLADGAYVPIALQSLAGIINLGPRLNIRRIGFTHLGHSFLFFLLLTLAFRNEG